MHEIDGPGHLGGEFVAEDALNNQPGTLVTPEWLNAVQAEIVNVIKAAGLVLSKSDNTQLNQALNKLIKMEYIHLREESAAGVNPSANISGIQTRNLNTVKFNNILSASLASNQITLPAGTYIINAFCGAGRVDNTRLYLYNVTDNVFTLLGMQYNAQASSSSDYIQTLASLNGAFTIPSSKVFEIRHYTQSVDPLSLGLGSPINYLSQPEVYSDVQIWKQK